MFDSIKNSNDMVSAWREYFSKSLMDHRGCKVLLIDDTRKMNKFYDRFLQKTTEAGLDKKNVFFMLHEAYAYANDINLDTISHIIAQEHDPFSFENLHKDFIEPKVVFIVRDPRAAFAGAYKGVSRKCIGDPNCWDRLIRLLHAQWVYAMQIQKKEDGQKNYYVIKNEDLNGNIEHEMKLLSRILGIEYNKSIIKSSSFIEGKKWIVDSCYITRKTQIVRPNFMSQVQKRERWMSILTNKDILMIESICKDLMHKFNYERITKDNFKNTCL